MSQDLPALAYMWQTVESDPGLFTELLERLGVKNVEVNEILTLEDPLLEEKHMYGLLLLFKYRKSSYASIPPGGTFAPDAPVFFARQIAENACATQALLAVLLNSNAELGTRLSEFRSFVQGFDAESAGEAIASSEFLRTNHNFMCRPIPFFEDGPVSLQDEENDEIYHYVAYVPFGDQLYELDGLRLNPVSHGAYTLENLRQVVLGRMQAHSSDLRLSLLAIVPDSLHQAGADVQAIAEAHDKRDSTKRENQLRRQDYTGLALELVKQLAAKRTESEWEQLGGQSVS